MTARRKAATDGCIVRPAKGPARLPDRLARRLAGGGFSVGASEGAPIRALPDGAAWRIEGSVDLEGACLERGADGGFVLRRAAGEGAIAESMPPDGFDRDERSRSILLEDGRLFRMVLRGPRHPRFELAGWETSGAYWIAQPASEGWLLRPTPAGGELGDLDVLTILFAAEVLDSDDAENGECPERAT